MKFNSQQQNMTHQCHSEPVSPYTTYTYISRKSIEEEETSQLSKVSRISLLNSSELNYRINQLKPKSKITIKKKMSECTTLAQTKKKEYVQTEQLHSKIELDFTPTRRTQSVITESIQYNTIKPAFNWNKLNFLCGFNAVKLGQQGCLCKQPCPWRTQWTKAKTKNDHLTFKKLLRQKPKNEDLIQIDKDIDRTHSDCPTFRSNDHFKRMLRSILVVYSIYDYEMGYVQGMNMIAGVLLYHIKNAQETFWAFVQMMEVKQLRTVYLQGFVHLKNHCNSIIELLQAKVNDLYLHMLNLQILPQTFINGWLLSLMSNYIPIEYMHKVVDQFKKNGFKFLYRLILSYLLFLKQRLLLCDDQSEFLFAVSLKNSRQLGFEWEEVIESSHKLVL